MFQSNCQFQSDFQWLPEVGDWLPEMRGDPFFNQIKKCWFHLGEISVAWYVSSDYLVQECSVATSLLSLQYPVQDPWILWLPSPSGCWGDGDAGWAGAGLCCLLSVEITTYKN